MFLKLITFMINEKLLIRLAVEILEFLAKKSDNQLDDELVKIVKDRANLQNISE